MAGVQARMIGGYFHMPIIPLKEGLVKTEDLI